MVFEIGVCSQTITQSYLLVGFIVLALVLLVMGFKHALFGLFSGLSMIVLSWFVVGCIGLIGYIFAILGLVTIIYFATHRPV